MNVEKLALVVGKMGSQGRVSVASLTLAHCPSSSTYHHKVTSYTRTAAHFWPQYFAGISSALPLHVQQSAAINQLS
jgi:hypothetical protein